MEQQGFVRGVGALGEGSQKQRLGEDVGNDGRNAVVRARQQVMQWLDQCARSVWTGQTEQSACLACHFEGLGVGEATAQGGNSGRKFQQPPGRRGGDSFSEPSDFVAYQLAGQIGAGQVQHFDKVGLNREQCCHHQVKRVFPDGLVELAIQTGIGSRGGQGGGFLPGELGGRNEHLSQHLPPVLRGLERVKPLGLQRIEQLREAAFALPATGERLKPPLVGPSLAFQEQQA